MPSNGSSQGFSDRTGIVYAVIFFSLIFSAIFVFLLEKKPIKSLYYTIFSGFGEPVRATPTLDNAPGIADSSPPDSTP